MDDDCLPRGVCFGCGLRALREVWKSIRALELSAGLGSTLSELAMTGDATSLVDVFAMLGVERLRIPQCLRAQNQTAHGEPETNRNQQYKGGPQTPTGDEPDS
jgi:hypothetical protein